MEESIWHDDAVYDDVDDVDDVDDDDAYDEYDDDEESGCVLNPINKPTLALAVFTADATFILLT